MVRFRPWMLAPVAGVVAVMIALVAGGGGAPRAAATRFLGDFYAGRVTAAAALTEQGDRASNVAAMKMAYATGVVALGFAQQSMSGVRWTVEACKPEGRAYACPVSFANEPLFSPLVILVSKTPGGGYRVDGRAFVNWVNS